MRALLCLPILLVAVACASSHEAAEEPPEPVAVTPPSEASKIDGPPAEGQDRSFWDNFVDDEDDGPHSEPQNGGAIPGVERLLGLTRPSKGRLQELYI